MVSLISACLFISACSDAKPPVITIHLNCVGNSVVQCIPLEHGDGQVLVGPRAILSDADFASVGLTPDGADEGRSPILAIEFSQSASETLWETTRQNIGRTLIFSVDGYVISDANILEPIRGPKGQFTLSVSRKEADELIARIRSNRQ